MILIAGSITVLEAVREIAFLAFAAVEISSSFKLISSLAQSRNASASLLVAVSTMAIAICLWLSLSSMLFFPVERCAEAPFSIDIRRRLLSTRLIAATAATHLFSDRRRRMTDRDMALKRSSQSRGRISDGRAQGRRGQDTVSMAVRASLGNFAQVLFATTESTRNFKMKLFFH